MNKNEQISDCQRVLNEVRLLPPSIKYEKNVKLKGCDLFHNKPKLNRGFYTSLMF